MGSREIPEDVSLVRQCEHGEDATQLGVGAQALVRTYRAKTFAVAFETGCHTYASPATDT